MLQTNNSGIYKITNIINDKVYIGQTKRLNCRKEEHLKKLRNNKHINYYLQNAFNKYGESNFVFEIIEKCEEKDLNEKETYWLNFYKPNVYNLGATGNVNTMSEETRLKIGKGAKKPCKEETRLKISLAQKGKKRRKHTEEEKKIISEKNKGKIVSEETRQKMRMSALGKKRTEESKQKNRLKHLGKPVSEKTRELRRKNILGRIGINNGISQKRIIPEQLEYYLSNGWQKGWLKKCPL